MSLKHPKDSSHVLEELTARCGGADWNPAASHKQQATLARPQAASHPRGSPSPLSG